MPDNKDLTHSEEIEGSKVYYNPSGVKAMALLGPEALAALFSYSNKYDVNNDEYLAYCLCIDTNSEGKNVFDVVFVKYTDTSSELPDEMLNYIIQEKSDLTYSIQHHFCLLT